MISLIPLPNEYKITGGNFSIDPSIKVNSDFELPLLRAQRSDDGKIKIEKNDSLGKEEYTLNVKTDEILIKASTQIGAYYALQSLRQLCKLELSGKSVPCCEISDKPSFEWRGINLDESRHFFGKEQVKRLLDWMFMMKLNRFHWHLTDDQGWRIEIKKYPLLTQIGSKRKYTHINGWNSTDILNEEYGGFYTQDDIKEIVEYAAERGIEVIPEIDFPAHCAAAMAAYPWIACRELKREVPGYFGGRIPMKNKIFDWNRTACAGKDSTFEFIFNIIDEICELFPAPYFHIGGDEAPKNEWKKCPHCQKRMAENNLKNEEDLQGWFNNKILQYLKQKGKRLIGWNEILAAGNIDSSVIAQYWTPKRDRQAEQFANSGSNMILSNHQSFYFDMTYAMYPLKNTYDYSPEKFKIDQNALKNVLGVEGEIWSEWIDCKEKLEMQSFPRMQALAEVAWTDESKRDWDDFKLRLNDFKQYFKVKNVNYAVDKISLPNGILSRLKIQAKFKYGDTHLELKMNKKYKNKGEI
ncbi:MAG: beta-N-acetylhexosaminidase [Clostridiales bacterium]|nr:beta-N-acetylhexosaminidase [Clostridiales bacterium]